MRLLILSLLACVSAWATNYNITGVRVIKNNATATSACNDAVVGVLACNGSVLEVDIATIAAGGTYNLGITQASNYTSTNATIVLTVTRSGYLGGASCGSTTTYTQLVYATHVLREPYPNPTVNDETSAAGTFTTRLALASDTGPATIMSGDAVTYSIATGFYTQGADTNNAATGTATNNSTFSYATSRVIFNWTYPGFQRVSGSSITVRATGGSPWSLNSRPLSCVTFTVTDQHAHTNSVNVTAPTIDNSLKDMANVQEWIGKLSTSGLTAGDQVTVNFKAYPWYGTSASVMDSSDGTYTQNSPFYAPIYFVYDPNNTYSAAAAVDPSQNVTGSVTSGTFTAGELLTQATSNATAYLIGTVTGSNPMVIGQTRSGTPDNSHDWVGGTSGAHYTPTATPSPNGSDSNSCAVAESAYNYPVTPSSACATVSGGLAKMEAFNAATSSPTHADACGTLYIVTSAGWNWLGVASATSNTTGYCWANVKNANGVNSFVQAQAGNQGFGSRCAAGSLIGCGTPLHLQTKVNVSTSPVSVFSGITFLWVDCAGDTSKTISSNGTAPFYQFRIAYITECTLPSTFGANGLKSFGGENAIFSLIRGNDLSTVGASGINAYTVVGNTNNSAQNLNVRDGINGQSASVMPIVAFNTFYKLNQGSFSPLGLFTATSTSPIGAWLAGNIWENVQTDTTSVVGIAADSSTASPVNDVMIVGNSIAGGRINRGYNDSGTNGLLRQMWTESQNIFGTDAVKSDTFGTANGNRVGNWSILYGTGNSSNVYWENTSQTVAGNFCPEWPGMNLYQTAITAGATQPPTCATNANTFIKFINNQSYNGVTNQPGGGNYGLLGSSPANGLVKAGTQHLSYDCKGAIRNNSGYGAAGACESTFIPQVFLTF